MSDDWKSNLKELYQREQKLAEDRERERRRALIFVRELLEGVARDVEEATGARVSSSVVGEGGVGDGVRVNIPNEPDWGIEIRPVFAGGSTLIYRVNATFSKNEPVSIHAPEDLLPLVQQLVEDGIKQAFRVEGGIWYPNE